MGCTVREKHIRTNRRSRATTAARAEADQFPASITKSILESGLKPPNCHLGTPNSTQNSNPDLIPNPNLHSEDSDWGYFPEEQLEEILLKNLEVLYNEAVSKLVALGYDEDVVLKAILKNGHCYGGMDVLTNILHNSLAYLNSNCSSDGGGSSSISENSCENGVVFTDLRQLEEYSLASMVRLLQQVRPHLSKGDAMWCLLMSDLHVGRASSVGIPVPAANSCSEGNSERNNKNNTEGVTNNTVGAMAPMLCRFHGGWGFANGCNGELPVNDFFTYGGEMNLQRDSESPRKFNLSPSMKSMLRRNAAAFAAGFRANQRNAEAQSQPCQKELPSGDCELSSGSDILVEQCQESQTTKQDEVSSVLGKFRDLNLEEKMESVTDDQKDEMIVTLLHQIKELEKQVKERKEWAHQKAMQAARKLSNDLNELKILRMEREETQRLKKGKQTLEDTTMKRLSEMENALRKASGQVDRANAAVRRLETENAETRAELEASKLSASESVKTCLEVAKREKKCLKKLLTWEKQKTKLQEEIADEKHKSLDVQQRLAQIKQAQKDAEVKWRQQQKAKELALAQVEEEQRLKEAAEANSKRKLEALRLKIEIDFQRHKDDLQRLEQEHSRLKASPQSTELPANTPPRGNSEGPKPQNEALARLIHELDKIEASLDKEADAGRECMICMKDEVSIVFLPCAHQVLCASCNDNHVKKGRTTCPCCKMPIEQRIRVFGATS